MNVDYNDFFFLTETIDETELAINGQANNLDIPLSQSTILNSLDYFKLINLNVLFPAFIFQGFKVPDNSSDLIDQPNNETFPSVIQPSTVTTANLR